MTTTTLQDLRELFFKKNTPPTVDPSLLGAFTVREVPSLNQRWSLAKALEVLEVRQIPFDTKEGENSLGYSYGDGEGVDRTLAIRSNIDHPLRVYLHELGHLVLGHGARAEVTLMKLLMGSDPVKEIHAEMVAFILASALGTEGVDFDGEVSQGYITNYLRTRAWADGHETLVSRDFEIAIAAAKKILYAGTV